MLCVHLICLTTLNIESDVNIMSLIISNRKMKKKKVFVWMGKTDFFFVPFAYINKSFLWKVCLIALFILNMPISKINNC